MYIRISKVHENESISLNSVCCGFYYVPYQGLQLNAQCLFLNGSENVHSKHPYNVKSRKKWHEQRVNNQIQRNFINWKCISLAKSTNLFFVSSSVFSLPKYKQKCNAVQLALCCSLYQITIIIHKYTQTIPSFASSSTHFSHRLSTKCIFNVWYSSSLLCTSVI